MGKNIYNKGCSEPVGGIPNCSGEHALLVSKMIGSAYDVVKYVAMNMNSIVKVSRDQEAILFLAENMEKLISIFEDRDAYVFLYKNRENLIKVFEELDYIISISDNLPELLKIAENVNEILQASIDALRYRDETEIIAEEIRDIGSDAVSQGNVPIYNTAIGVSSINIPKAIRAIRINGFYNEGDGGKALYKKTDSEPTHAGKIKSADGAWWELSENIVNYAMFGADLTGNTPADVAMINCHDYANKMNAKVVQKWGIVLWRSSPISVKTDCDLSGLTVRLDKLSGDPTPTYNHPYVYHIDRSEEPVLIPESQITDLMTIPSHYLQPLSKRIDHPIFKNNPHCLIRIFTSVVDINRNVSDIVIPVRDYVVTGRNGNLIYGLDKDISKEISTIVVYPREKKRLYFKSPLFLLDGAASVGGIIVERNNVKIDGVCVQEPVPNENSIRNFLFTKYSWDVEWVAVSGEAMPYGGSGTYMMGAEGVVCLKYSGFQGWSGWGITGTNWVKDIVFEDCALNRYDVHWACYGFYANRCTMINKGISITGGGICVARDCRWILTDYSLNSGDFTSDTFWEGREDYGYEFSGTLIIDGLTVEISRTIPAVNQASLTIARLGGLISYDPGRNITLPQNVSISNVTVNVSSVLGTTANPFTLNCVYLGDAKHTTSGRQIFYPRSIAVDDVGFINPAQGQHLRISAVTGFSYADETVWIRGDNADTSERYGTNCDIVLNNIRPIVPELYMPHETGGIIRLIQSVSTWSDHYINDANGWFPRISIENCPHVWLDVVIKGVVQVDRSVIHRVDRDRGGLGNILFRAISCDIKPADRTQGSGTAFDLVTGKDGCYIGCGFYLPKDDADESPGEISLAGTKGSGNYLVDATTTNYPNAPSGFFT